MDISWDDKYETGVERIDFEHRIFVGLIKDLSDAVDSNKPRAKISRVIDEIRLYAAFHFISEENIMLDVDYPDYAAHKKEHQRLLSLMEDKAHGYTSDEAYDGQAIVEFVFQWFALHTTQVDKQIADFVSPAN